MDETTLNELLECSVCLERLEVNNKVLPCQHTFCRKCLDGIVSSKNELRCPECRTLVKTKVEDLPPNILLNRLLEGMKTASGSIVNSGAKSASPVQRIDISSEPCAKALYQYKTNEPGDLTFKKGELISLKKKVDDNWYLGQIGEKQGFFPSTYVEVITPLPGEPELPKCTALYDFVLHDENEKDCLSFQKDDVITVIRRVDDNWAEGKMDDRIGIFPISFVDMNEKCKSLLNSQRNSITHQTSRVVPSTCSSSMPTSPLSTSAALATTIMSISYPTDAHLTHPDFLATHRTSQKRHSLSNLGQTPARCQALQLHRHSAELSGHTVVAIPSTPVTLVTTAGQLVVTSGAILQTPSPSSVSNEVTQSSSGNNKPHPLVIPRGEPSSAPVPPLSSPTGSFKNIYLALYNYKQQKDDELELRKGHCYQVSEKCQDGWYKGRCLTTNATGVFPGNYVQLVRWPSSSKSVMNGVSRDPSNVSPSRTQGQIAIVRPTSVRTNFPKTTPHLVRNPSANNTPLPRPNITVTHTRTITNITQAQTRTIMSVTQAQTRAVSSSCAITQSQQSTGVDAAAPVMSNSPNTALVAPQVTVTPCEQVQSNQPLPSSSSTNGAIAGAGAGATGSSHSPRSSRKHKHVHRSKSPLSVTSAHHVHKIANNSPLHHSMATTTTITPPNVTICGTTGDPIVVPHCSNKKHRNPESRRRKERREHHSPNSSNTSTSRHGAEPQPSSSSAKERRDKTSDKSDNNQRRDKGDKLSMLKRMTVMAGVKGKKSKSPPPSQGAKVEGASGSSGESVLTEAGQQRSAPVSENSQVSLPGAAACPTVAVPNAVKVKKVPSGESNNSPPTAKLTKSRSILKPRWRCTVAYPPQNERELALQEGDVVIVIGKHQEGWFKGIQQRTGKTGLFPQSFAVPL